MPPKSIVSADKPAIICIAGFGDDGSLFAPLQRTELTECFRIVPLDLPGFGGGSALGETSLDILADFVCENARKERARVLIAHSVASIIASLAAERSNGMITTIVSLEGNLTAPDAYFSGTAADYDDPATFREAFLNRLSETASDDRVVDRYRSVVAKADPRALWQLGCDARSFSQACVPGERLQRAAHAVYLYNPLNCPRETLDWLEANPIARRVLERASHWPTIDQPKQTAFAVMRALDNTSRR